ncbi:MAG TPA: CRISPR-associated helicase Cas3', partial [Chloroflexi bacterium]|nr:CRISPR-associated helicase Cas3' [Chloroflexota bacterium]
MVGRFTGASRRRRRRTSISSSVTFLEDDRMKLYPYQKRVYDLLSAGKSVVLQAPTGAGKTAAALYPFLRAWEHGADFPRKCIYSVPLRVLADQFEEAYSRDVANFGFTRSMAVTIQTGARPDDRKMEGNLIFTTVDQTLSNFLNIPYALSTGQGNLNAGAVLSAYLVFDELHLFDPGTMLPTVLHLLRMLRGVAPFLVMTATLSEEMVRALARQLDAEAIVLSAEEAAAIPSQHKIRRVHTVEQELTASAVLENHQGMPSIPRRSIAICNTVNRAQALFEDLREQVGPGIEVRLLHSRFLPGDRAASEDWLRREFGKEKSDYTVESAILVATQVVEVGLDITSQALHTELAPAASVIQRAGRCARYRGEEGDVYVYRLPPNRHGNPNYAPYLGEQKAICEKTREALAKRSGESFDFGAELTVVNTAHGEADRRMLDRLQANRHYLVERIADTIAAQERGAARELIRDVDSRTVIVHPDPDSIENPWAYDGFGIYRGTLFGAYEALEELAYELDEDWALMTAEGVQEEESSRAPTVWEWWDIACKEDLKGALFVAVNPRLARYSAETGFQLGVAGDPGWQSPLRERKGKRRHFAPYQRETFQEHVTRMLRVYELSFYDRGAGRQRLALGEEMAYAARRLEDRYGWPDGTLDRLARLLIALHDLGKLDERWQAWAHRWQAEVGELRGADLALPEDYVAAHTDYDSQDPVEETLNRKLGRARPNHAAESAQAAEDLLWACTGEEALVRASLTVIARHHSAGARGRYGDFRAHLAAPAALADVLEALDPAQVQWRFAEGTLARKLVRPDRQEELLPYLLL